MNAKKNIFWDDFARNSDRDRQPFDRDRRTETALHKSLPTWPQTGMTDHVRIFPDGRSIAGTNYTGVSVAGTKR